jgi:hypothetical protein
MSAVRERLNFDTDMELVVVRFSFCTWRDRQSYLLIWGVKRP